MFKNLRLKTKIGLMFGFVLAMLSIVLGISINALQRTDEGISEYRGLARDTNLSGRIQANMLMVRMNVKDYIITNSEKDLQQYSEYLSKMQDLLNDAKQEIQQPDRASLIADVSKAMVSYQSAFDKTVDLIVERKILYDSRLVPNGERMRVAIDDIIKSAYQDGDSEAAYHAGHVQQKMLIGRLFVVKFLQSNLSSDFEIAIKNMQVLVSEEIEDLNGKLQNPKLRVLFKEFSDAHEAYVQDMRDINYLIVKRNDIIQNTLDVLGPEVAKYIEDMKMSIMKDQDTLGPELKANTDASVMLSLTLSVIAIMVGILSAYFLTNAITRPIQKAVDAANQLAEGDLTVDVGITSKDETGKLLDAVQNTANRLTQMISTISNASSELASASEELAVVTEQTSKGISQQETETEMVATAMNEMATTVHDVADNAVKASDAANQADTEAISGSQVVQQTIASINSLSERVNDSSVKLDDVEQEVVNISKILHVIREIADQTNLLALNAAIEAARAGEQGRGFAVVADEVRSLAARTQGSTSEIQSIIEQLQMGTQSTVEAMKQGQIEADNCVNQANKASMALEEITNAISVINDMNMQIASASEQQSTVAEDINRNVVNVKRIAEENSLAAHQTNSSSTEIARLAEGLGQLVSEFKV
ncbi:MULTISPECIES: methyl-accepting chemotaxis protein [unclassified Vibrio]|jgi:methyl-accepting chemotaxis protein|uniref:HAMP domain-containing methyl-accepting chemotaxis protein n=1 Tax=unclassified Vibrio TaxID=2614977 RepID=UPI0020BEC1A3|nr:MULTISPECIES: methyl-accepting chemotaxis protein [unclassified Vibrio]MCK8082118.1 methyl-accepting chemotaxis protein [Vibrio sp. 1CM24A]MCK8084049.1 methyl-accepting chemotaxis protein [Vibrio sp. 1CM8B]